MLARLLRRVRDTGRAALVGLRRRLLAATKPTMAAPIAGTLADLIRSRPELIAENALLRQQLLVLRRSVNRPRCTATDRRLLVLLASRVQAWRQALLIVQPDTLLRWHRQLFRGFWRWKSRTPSRARQPKVSAEAIALIRAMATANRLWGAERIRGELLQLDIRVAKWTVQKYMRAARPPRRVGQTWGTFLRNHAPDIWACDFLPVTDALFRPLHAFVVIALGSRRVVHVGVTRHPTDTWVAQQLREATPFGEQPRYLIRDRDSKYGPAFTRLTAATGIEELRTAYRAPRENATCERFLGSVRRECLDHVLVLSEGHLRRVLREYVAYFNTARPHQGMEQRIPEAGAALRLLRPELGRTVRAIPVLGELHHAYQRAA
jgi:putative transposase